MQQPINERDEPTLIEAIIDVSIIAVGIIVAIIILGCIS
jgi:hypothetical protein